MLWRFAAARNSVKTGRINRRVSKERNISFSLTHSGETVSIILSGILFDGNKRRFDQVTGEELWISYADKQTRDNI